MATTINPPVTFGQTQAIEGYDRLIVEQQLLDTMEDRLDLTGLGLATLVGDVAQSGTDVLQVNFIDGIGFGTRMTEIAEGDAVAPSPFALGYSQVSVGDFGIGYEETYKQQGMGRALGATLDKLIASIPNAWRSTIRYLMCVAGQGITNAVGSASTTASLDDLLDFLTEYELTPGAGKPMLVLKNKQAVEIKRSLRNEPSFQSGGASDFGNAQGLRVGANGIIDQVERNFAGLGLDIARTDDVQTSTGAFQGFGYSEGGMGWARMGTGALRTANPNGTIFAPEYGLLIEELTDGARQTIRAVRGTAWIGVALGAPEVFLQRRLISLAS